jgi:uncharacterized membrane protein YdjX (TVP38/TMEM64 family)/rhodanese-related sulfurtransferase
MRGATLARGLLLLLLAAAAAAALFNARLLDGELVRRLAADSGVLAPAVFVAAYALATVLFLPGSILTLAGGALFGPVAGTFYSLTGATLGAAIAFLIARHLASDWAARHAGGRLGEFIRGVEAEGWRFVAFVRLVPLFPFNALNYALGLTRIPLAQYVAASYLAMLPGAAAYTYLGFAGREALAGSDALLRHGLIGLALLAAALFLPRLVRRMRRQDMIDLESLRRRLAKGEALTIVDVRGADEYEGPLGHIAGSVNIPLPELERRLPELRQSGRLVLVCRTDKRSAKAAEILRARGLAAEVLAGGMQRWTRMRPTCPPTR